MSRATTREFLKPLFISYKPTSSFRHSPLYNAHYVQYVQVVSDYYIKPTPQPDLLFRFCSRDLSPLVKITVLILGLP